MSLFWTAKHSSIELDWKKIQAELYVKYMYQNKIIFLDKTNIYTTH